MNQFFDLIEHISFRVVELVFLILFLSELVFFTSIRLASIVKQAKIQKVTRGVLEYLGNIETKEEVTSAKAEDKRRREKR